MKSILKVKFHAVDYHTYEKIKFTKHFLVEGVNFVDKITEPMIINNGELVFPSTTISATQLANDWLSEQNSKLQDIIDNPKLELKCILDWEILSIKNISDKGEVSMPTNNSLELIKVEKHNESSAEYILEILKSSFKANIDEGFSNDFIATHNELKDALKGLSIERKIDVIFSAMSVGYKSAMNSLKMVRTDHTPDDTDGKFTNEIQNRTVSIIDKDGTTIETFSNI